MLLGFGSLSGSKRQQAIDWSVGPDSRRFVIRDASGIVGYDATIVEARII
jgi:hypothetical protein